MAWEDLHPDEQLTNRKEVRKGMTSNTWKKENSDREKISYSLWFLDLLTAKSINVHREIKTCSVSLVCEMGISKPRGMGVLT